MANPLTNNNKRKRNQRRKSLQAKQQDVLAFGSSYIDFLPDDVTHAIFKSKHSMEFAPTLDMI